MEAISGKLATKSFQFLGNIYLIFNIDFSKSELEVLKKNGWCEYRRYWHMAPEGWSPTK